MTYPLADSSVSVTYSDGIDTIKPLSFVNWLVFVGIDKSVISDLLWVCETFALLFKSVLVA